MTEAENHLENARNLFRQTEPPLMLWSPDLAVEELLDLLTIRIKITDELDYPHTSKPSRISSTVDPDTGTITIWSTFENPDHILRPGMRVSVISEIDEAAVKHLKDF